MKSFLLKILLLYPILINAQVGGKGTYAFLNLTHSARVAALGSKTIAIDDGDLSIAVLNPSLLNASMHNHVTLNYVNYIADINFGYAGYAYRLDPKSTVGVGIQYINYGTFDKADATGEINGEFTANENAVNLMYSRQLDSNFALGVTFKPVISSMERYNSVGFASDIGAHYTSDDKLFCGGLVLRNMGTQISRYSEISGYEPLPFEIIAGMSKKMEHAPFRISITAHQLQQLKMSYLDSSKTSVDPLTGALILPGKLSSITDNLMRHLIFGVEFLPFKNFYFRVGYNYQRQKEMALPDKTGAVGFSWGFGLKIKKIAISYGRASYHMAAASNHFSIALNLSEFYHKSELMDR